MVAFRVSFAWLNVATWVYITEYWPVRSSWLIHFCLTNQQKQTTDDTMSLKTIYDRIKGYISANMDMSPLLEMDKEEAKLEEFLSTPKIPQVHDILQLSSFTISLDPRIREMISECNPTFESSNAVVSVDNHHIQDSSFEQGVVATFGTVFPEMNRNFQELQEHSTQPFISYPRSSNRSSLTSSQTLMEHSTHGRISYPSSSNRSSLTSMMSPTWGFYGEAILSAQALLPGTQTHLPNILHSNSTGASGKILSKLKLEDLYEMLDDIDGLSEVSTAKYKKMFQEQNITGRVLSNCQLEQLKELLPVSFGEWELFRMAIEYLRKTESEIEHRNTSLQEDKPHRNRKSGIDFTMMAEKVEQVFGPSRTSDRFNEVMELEEYTPLDTNEDNTTIGGQNKDIYKQDS
ncbi:unnamed protein product [Meganyctiphanes norvegica]|uniref:Kinase D-interacting substrate of 220 kDa-like SAM domain-containing protein n=1 Tax=Meganyctiphanes norvegica TaxID=48144 RepID=A0AAV2QL91_MEGNR